MTRLSAAERARLPGISAARARQSLAGALVVRTAMRMLGIDQVTVCPGGLREGLLLRRLESGEGRQQRAAPPLQPVSPPPADRDEVDVPFAPVSGRPTG